VEQFLGEGYYVHHSLYVPFFSFRVRTAYFAAARVFCLQLGRNVGAQTRLMGLFYLCHYFGKSVTPLNGSVYPIDDTHEIKGVAATDL
jgi:hypothetical protein